MNRLTKGIALLFGYMRNHQCTQVGEHVNIMAIDTEMRE